jgi:hypothetical protein
LKVKGFAGGFAGGFGNFYTMKRNGGPVSASTSTSSSASASALASMYKDFVEDYLQLLHNMEKLEELKYSEKYLVRYYYFFLYLKHDRDKLAG